MQRAQASVFILGQATVGFGRLPLTESSSDVVLWLISVKIWKVSNCFRKTSVTSSDVFESSALIQLDSDRAWGPRRHQSLTIHRLSWQNGYTG